MFCVQIDRSCVSATARLRPIVALLFVVGLGLGGCAQRPQEVSVSHGKEYFPSSIYGPASRRVIADGQPIPHGGGKYLVGKPYSVAGRTYYPSESRATQVGYASWYGDAFHGRLTANGEIYDRASFTAASPTLPLPSYARVTNLRNNYSMIVRVNDRGPYASDRIMDVSRRVAEALDYKRYGTTKVKVEYVGRASLAGSDDTKLYATLHTDKPASWQGEPTMVAAVAPRVRVASTASYVTENPDPASVRLEAASRRRSAYGARTRPSQLVSETEPQEPPMRHRRVAMADEAESPRGDRISSRERYDGEVPGRGSAANYRNFSRWSQHYAERENRNEIGRLGARDILPPPRPDRAERSRPIELAHAGLGTRTDQISRYERVMPPSRPMDLGTIPGAASQIHAHREPPRLHLARSRED